MLARIRVGVAGWSGPQAGEDFQLFFETVETFTEGRKGNRIGFVFLAEPSRTQPEIHSTAAHFVNLGDSDGQWSRMAKGGGSDEGTQTDGGGLPGNRAEGYPCVGGSGQSVGAAHR
ncbi:Uncharacterised protein [Mycobacteroides abscessus]|nr:Uncharacterised protein [Mycobacteroides abscessus]